MNVSSSSDPLLGLKVIGALVVGVGASFFGLLIAYVGDIGTNEGPFERAAFVWTIFFFGGLYVGVLVPRFWYLAIAIAWAPIIMIVPALRHLGEVSAGNRSALWIMMNTTLVSPVVALASGYLGSRIHKQFSLWNAKESKYLVYIWSGLLALPLLLILYWAATEWRAAPEYEYLGMCCPSYALVAPAPLHEAAAQGNLSEIKRLIENRENIDVKDAAGRTPLHYAVGEKQTAAVELLLAYGANPDIQDYEYKVTPLHWAVGSGSPDIVKLLAPKMKNIDARNEQGQTAAEIARQDKQNEILKILIAHGAKIEAQE